MAAGRNLDSLVRLRHRRRHHVDVGAMSSPLGEYAQKAVNAGLVILKLKKFLGTDAQSIELSREEVESIMLVIREFSAKMGQIRKKFGGI